MKDEYKRKWLHTQLGVYKSAQQGDEAADCPHQEGETNTTTVLQNAIGTDEDARPGDNANKQNSAVKKVKAAPHAHCIITALIITLGTRRSGGGGGGTGGGGFASGTCRDVAVAVTSHSVAVSQLAV